MDTGDNADPKHNQGRKGQAPAKDTAGVVENEADAENQRDQSHAAGQINPANGKEAVPQMKTVGNVDGVQEKIAASHNHGQPDEKTTQTATGTTGTPKIHNNRPFMI